MSEAICGYMKDEAHFLFSALIRLNAEDDEDLMTVDDLLLRSDRLSSIVSSGAGGSLQTVESLLENIGNTVGSPLSSLSDRVPEMVGLVNKYTTSGQELRRNGRKHFAYLYAAQDMVSFFSNVFINKTFQADYTPFCGTFS